MSIGLEPDYSKIIKSECNPNSIMQNL